MVSAAYRLACWMAPRTWAGLCVEIAIFVVLRLPTWLRPSRANLAAKQQCLGNHSTPRSHIQGLATEPRMSRWIQRLRDRRRRATDDWTGEIQLALGHIEDCELDDEQRRMRRSANAAHSRPLIGAPPLQPQPYWQKATGAPYVIDLEMETSATVGVAQTGRCVVCISALGRQLQGTTGRVKYLTFRTIDDRTGEIQLALGHIEDCELDDEQRRMRRSANAAHSRPLIGAPPLQPQPYWQKATGAPYVIDLEMETSATVGVAQTGRCVVCISALRRIAASIDTSRRFRGTFLAGQMGQRIFDHVHGSAVHGQYAHPFSTILRWSRE